MIAQPVGRYLVHFGVDEELPAPEPFDNVMQPLSLKSEETAEHRETMLEAAREEGRNEIRAALQAFFESKLAEQKRGYDMSVIHARNVWIEEESTKFSSGLNNAIAQLQAMLSEGVDTILRPFLIETLRRQMIDELVANVGILLASDEIPVIEISGAADFLAVLQRKLSDTPATITYQPADSIDVKIVAHHTVIESQLQAWIERFDPTKE